MSRTGNVAVEQAHHQRRTLGGRVARATGRMRGDFPLIVLDLVIVVGVYLLLYMARFDFDVPSQFWDTLRVFLPAACVVSVGTNALLGCYGRTWRHASIDEGVRLIGAGFVTLVTLLVLFVWGFERVPLTVLVAGPVLATALFGLLRFQSRVFAYKRRSYQGSGIRVAIVGAGSAASAALREMQRSPQLGLTPILAVDDNTALRWRTIHGVPIVGAIDDLPDAVEDHAINQILLAIPSADAKVVQRVAEIGEQSGLPVRVLPESSSWANGMPRLRDMRDLDIEDLLGRKQVQIDLETVRQLLAGRRVLVTGGGGWIGAEIARQIAGFQPARLLLLDHDETHLHDAQQRIGAAAEIALGDIRDATWSRPSSTRSGRRWCSTRPRTSTCRSSSSSPAKRSARTCSARSTSSTRRRASVPHMSSASPPTRRRVRMRSWARRSGSPSRSSSRTHPVTTTARCGSATCSGAGAV